VTTEFAVFATQRAPPTRGESGWFENTAGYQRRLLQIGGVKARGRPETFSLTGCGMVATPVLLITKWPNPAEFRGFVLNAPLSSANCR
jgi:hypothetical protein